MLAKLNAFRFVYLIIKSIIKYFDFPKSPLIGMIECNFQITTLNYLNFSLQKTEC